MKKIIFCDIPMKERVNKMNYANANSKEHKYKTPVIFPINAILAEKLKKNDDVKVVLLRVKDDGKKYSERNEALFETELNEINKNIGANISYKTIFTEFEESKSTHEKRLHEMLSMIENDCSIYADITYGPKPLPMILMCALTFAEKFFNADIKKIVYGKVDFIKDKNGETQTVNPELYDVTNLYYLNNLMTSMKASSGNEALCALDEFFKL